MSALPTRKNEAWRYSDLVAVARHWPVAVETIDVPAGATTQFLTLVSRDATVRYTPQVVTIDPPAVVTLATPASVLAGSALTLSGSGLDRIREVAFAGDVTAAVQSPSGSTTLRVGVPLDAASVLRSVQKTGRVVIVEENPGQLGWGASIAAILAEEAWGHLTAPVIRVSAGNVPLPVASELEAEVLVSPARVVNAVTALCKGSQSKTDQRGG
jgi:hypothetical protein